MLTLILVVVFVLIVRCWRNSDVYEQKKRHELRRFFIVLLALGVLLVYATMITYIVKYDERKAEVEYYQELDASLKEELRNTSDTQKVSNITKLIQMNEEKLAGLPDISEQRLKIYKFLIYFGEVGEKFLGLTD